MKDAIRHLDQRFAALKPLGKLHRPAHGWIRAIRDALGMTTAQLGSRLKVSQPRVVAIEKAEVSGAITLHSLERAAEALGCRVVYALVPDRSLTDVVRSRAEILAERDVARVEHTMLLEGQAVKDRKVSRELRRKRIDELLRRPSRLWDEI